MKNLINIFLIVIVGSLLLTSCVKADDPIYKDASDGASSLQFTIINSSYTMTPADTVFEIPFGVKLLGAPAKEDITVNLNLKNTTTVNITTQVILSANSVVIKAGHVQGNIFLTVHPDAFELSPDALFLDIGIDDAAGDIASYGGTSSFAFVYNVCPFDILNFLGGFICNEEGYGEYNVNFSLDASVENRIHNSNFWDWPAPGETLYYDLSGDANQIVTIPDQPFTFGDGVVGSVVGTGTYDACAGTFSCDYDVNYGGDIYPTHHDFYRPGAKKSSSVVAVKKPAFLKNH